MTDYQKSYTIALSLWDTLTEPKVEPFLETDKCPMHPYNFFELSQVRGFNINNGNTYEDYISKWRQRYNK